MSSDLTKSEPSFAPIKYLKIAAQVASFFVVLSTHRDLWYGMQMTRLWCECFLSLLSLSVCERHGWHGLWNHIYICFPEGHHPPYLDSIGKPFLSFLAQPWTDKIFQYDWGARPWKSFGFAFTLGHFWYFKSLVDIFLDPSFEVSLKGS